MASLLGSLRGLLSHRTTAANPSTKTITALTSSQTRSFSSTMPSSARAKAPVRVPGRADSSTPTRRSKRGPARSEHYHRIKILKMNMFSPAPPPLRMARLRHLRHWTIHRAWLLFRRNQKADIEKERARMHAGMHNACEELRVTSGPGEERAEGYLYRVAMEKKGVYGLDGVPIEYARFQTEFPAKKAWDHDWKRS